MLDILQIRKTERQNGKDKNATENTHAVGKRRSGSKSSNARFSREGTSITLLEVESLLDISRWW